MRTSKWFSKRDTTRSLGRVVLAASLVAAMLGWTTAAEAQSDQDVQNLRARLAVLDTELDTLSKDALACALGTEPQECALRVFLSGRLMERLFERVLAARAITFRMTRASGQLVNSGGGGAGCGYYVEVASNDLNADLNIRGSNASWSANGLGLRPDFRFVAWGTLHGHVRGPACPFTGCGCTIGGGAGTTVGVRTERDDSLPLTLRLAATSQGWAALSLVQPQNKKIDVTLSIGLQGIGNLGIPTSFDLPAATYFTADAPRAFGSEGQLEIPGAQPKLYRVDISPKPLEVSDKGFAVRLLPTIVWR
jgi:hypothetical protein